MAMDDATPPPLEGDEEAKVEKDDFPKVDEVGEPVGGQEGEDGGKRLIKKTAKAQQYHCELAKKECERLLRRLNRQEKLIDVLMESDENKDQESRV